MGIGSVLAFQMFAPGRHQQETGPIYYEKIASQGNSSTCLIVHLRWCQSTSDELCWEWSDQYGSHGADQSHAWTCGLLIWQTLCWDMLLHSKNNGSPSGIKRNFHFVFNLASCLWKIFARNWSFEQRADDPSNVDILQRLDLRQQIIPSLLQVCSKNFLVGLCCDSSSHHHLMKLPYSYKCARLEKMLWIEYLMWPINFNVTVCWIWISYFSVCTYTSLLCFKCANESCQWFEDNQGKFVMDRSSQ